MRIHNICCPAMPRVPPQPSWSSIPACVTRCTALRPVQALPPPVRASGPGAPTETITW